MATISKNRVTNNRFESITTDALELQYNVQITDDTIDFTLSNTQDNTDSIQLHLQLETFKNHTKYSAQSWFGIVNSVLNNDFNSTDGIVTPSSIQVVNLLEHSKITKTNELVPMNSHNSISNTHLVPIRIFFPSETSNFNDCIIQVAAPESGELDHSVAIVTNSDNVVVDEFIPWKDYFATITANSVVSGDNINVTVTVSDTNIEYVYLEPVVGILDKLKVKLTNGTGSFTIKTDTLSVGEVAEVKIGYKTYTNALTFTKTIE